TSADVLDATSFPDSGIVMGFGYIGLELAPYIAEAGGTDLTVIEHDARPLDEADPAFGDELLRIYEEVLGLQILTETYEERLEPTDDGGVRLYTDRDDEYATIEADQLFLFTGRRPAVDRLGLEQTSIDPGPDWVRETLQAVDDDRVFVVGDVNGKEPILHVAKEQGFLAADNLRSHRSGEPLKAYETLHHHVVFSGLGVVPYARLGHSAESATAAGYDTVTATRRAEDDGVFLTKDAPFGLARLVVDATDGTVLGYQGLHYHADVMAKTMQVVIEQALTVYEIPDRAYHPTTPEIIDGLVRETRGQLPDE
ncbi:MAG: FAD-dependent oxidoreductase, partial [Halobacteriales archaeon]|nr:FAD-dependent oxidoreductase [Halobacteriales archaeon]